MTDQPKVTVIGAGLMGHGIAQRFLAAGHPVNLVDPNLQVLEQAEQQISDIFTLLEQPYDKGDLLSLYTEIQPAVEDAGIVIEAGPEILEVKRDIFTQLARFSSPECILASNTSAIPISEIAKGILHPQRIVGAHFWNPPHLVRLVEVVQGDETSLTTVEQTIALLDAVGMKSVHVKRDIPGFIGNRLQHAMKREAIAMLEAGVCDAETIDDVVKHGFGQRLAVLGPLEQSDLVGLDLTVRILTTIYPSLDTSSTPQATLVKRVEAGQLGMKTGGGFRQWTPEAADDVRTRVREHLVAKAKQTITN
ncbi:MAG: 3-hydroxyacyl-CoA dehydrogenase NAD-binding domain-containing protein [Aliiglaciecola sp.]|uniref:3-hydroxyacyl-CoA dehydrogenase family protein n=1 Tax=Aliiglaciecola sp. TaxID=1872441 RepID=UPI0032978EC2